MKFSLGLCTCLVSLLAIDSVVASATFGAYGSVGPFGYRATTNNNNVGRRRGSYSSDSRNRKSYMPFDTEEDIDESKAVQQCSVSTQYPNEFRLNHEKVFFLILHQWLDLFCLFRFAF